MVLFYYIIYHSYELMMQCWYPEPNDRPTFQELSGSLSKYIEAIAGYLEITYNPFNGNQFGETEVEVEQREEEEEDMSEPPISIKFLTL